ncbi:MAG TPA: holo-ACP synthase [Baekduia sp.]|nr:holo-ACP synthase [Baekduia sp.]
MPLRVGIDLVKAATVREALAEHGDRYLRRVYTEAEIVQCGDDPLRLAARFAAKEAAMKVLRPGADDAVPWAAIEVLRDAHGVPGLTLHGPAAALARSAGLSDFAVSLTHEDEYAAAVVVGT